MTTPESGDRPSVFVSSTIYDFADLRDALKFWLEEMGFEVRMSEHTDFDHRPEAGTFEACFESVQTSDYYILLIGRNRGSLYDEESNVSVTQQEYRVAYESFQKTGQPHIVACVRQDVVTALKERAAAGATANGSTLKDWEFTQRFIEEVRREDEAKAAAAGAGDHPAGNWLTPFRDFRELITVIRSALPIRGPLPHLAMLEGLRWECSRNLRVLLGKRKGGPDYLHLWLDGVRREVNLSPDDLKDLNGKTTLTHKQIKHLIMQFNGGFPRPDAFVFGATQQAIVSGGLLNYNRERGTYEASQLLEALITLREKLDLYRVRYPAVEERRRVFLEAWFASNASKGPVKVPTFGLFELFSVQDQLHNICRILFATLRYLAGKTSSLEIQLRPVTPVPEFEEEIRREEATHEDLERWIEEDNPLLLLGMSDQTEEQRLQSEAIEKLVRERLGDEEWERLNRETTEEILKEYRDPEEGEEGQAKGPP